MSYRQNKDSSVLIAKEISCGYFIQIFQLRNILTFAVKKKTWLFCRQIFTNSHYLFLIIVQRRSRKYWIGGPDKYGMWCNSWAPQWNTNVRTLDTCFMASVSEKFWIIMFGSVKQLLGGRHSTVIG